MGSCLFHKQRTPDVDDASASTKEYSWDRRVRVEDPRDFTVEDLSEGEVVCRWPGSVDGRQFVIRNCRDAAVYLLDHVDSLTLDDCYNCTIVLGPVKGSLFVRDSVGCVCVAACGQFRVRDCRSLHVFLCCPTQPVLESSSAVHFGCYPLSYHGLQDHFDKAGLSVFNNEWSDVHDFTPVHGEDNWRLLPATASPQDYVSHQTPPDVLQHFTRLQVSLSAEKSLVPLTRGPRHRVPGESCLVAFFPDGRQGERARTFINLLRTKHPGCELAVSKEIQLNANDAERVLGSRSYEGRVVGLRFQGLDCMASCLQVSSELSAAGLVYVSRSDPDARVESFFSLARMQLYS